MEIKTARFRLFRKCLDTRVELGPLPEAMGTPVVDMVDHEQLRWVGLIRSCGVLSSGLDYVCHQRMSHLSGTFQHAGMRSAQRRLTRFASADRNNRTLCVVIGNLSLESFIALVQE